MWSPTTTSPTADCMGRSNTKLRILRFCDLGRRTCGGQNYISLYEARYRVRTKGGFTQVIIYTFLLFFYCLSISSLFAAGDEPEIVDLPHAKNKELQPSGFTCSDPRLHTRCLRPWNLPFPRSLSCVTFLSYPSPPNTAVRKRKHARQYVQESSMRHMQYVLLTPLSPRSPIYHQTILLPRPSTRTNTHANTLSHRQDHMVGLRQARLWRHEPRPGV